MVMEKELILELALYWLVFTIMSQILFKQLLKLEQVRIII